MFAPVFTFIFALTLSLTANANRLDRELTKRTSKDCKKLSAELHKDHKPGAGKYSKELFQKNVAENTCLFTYHDMLANCSKEFVSKLAQHKGMTNKEIREKGKMYQIDLKACYDKSYLNVKQTLAKGATDNDVAKEYLANAVKRMNEVKNKTKKKRAGK